MTNRDSAGTAPARPVVGFAYVEWGAIVAGAVSAAAISFVLLTFGSAIGLSAVSPWPNTGIPWWLLAIIGALWFLFVQAGSYALGGYLAGRMRGPGSQVRTAEREFRDGAHGFLVWALGVTITAVVLGVTAGAAVTTGVNAVSNVASSATQAAPMAIAALPDKPDHFGYAIDRVLRPAAGVPTQTQSAPTGPIPDDSGTRNEISRIFANSLETTTLAPEDRDYLVRSVSARTGASEADAQKQVDEAFRLAQQAQAAVRDAADKARKASAIGAFIVAAALLVAAAAAAWAAGIGGRHRDENGSLRFFGRDRFW